MYYDVVFELADKNFNLVWPPLTAIVILSIFVFFGKWIHKALNLNKISYIFLGLGFLFILSVLIRFYGLYSTKYWSLHQGYKVGEYYVVEGPVEQFDPMPKEGHKRESFTVNDVLFEYSDYELSPGFNNTSSHGGPIINGLQVRISYIGHYIVKLEVQK